MRASLSLITRADDAGLNASTNEGVRVAVAHGIARNVSVLAVGSALEDAAKRLRGLDACFGFHACLNSEWTKPRWAPLTRDARLKDTRGMLPESPAALRQLNPPVEAVVAELSAQLDRLRALDLPVVYMDEHMYFSSALPALRPVLENFARSEGLVYRMELPCLPAFAGEPEQTGDSARFLQRLRQAPSGTWLEINHPAVDSPEMHVVRKRGQPAGTVAAERAGQLRLFTDPSVVAACAREPVRLLRYDELEPSLVHP